MNIFNDVISWPEPKSPTNKRKRENTPSVVTSDKRVEYFELKEKKKNDKEKKKTEQRRKELDVKKVKFQQNTNKTRQIISDSTSEEEWVASGDSGDEHSLIEEDKEPQFSSVDQIKPGDFILTNFQSCGKETSAVFRPNYGYISVVSKILPNNEFEVNSLKSRDVKKKYFK
ncbi:hypothetical protein C0J52_21145 [Blattella germanica]|nr:hypothetical protein C0J52_21145 [Blattella germanica]